MAKISVSCQSCGAIVDVSKGAKQFDCEFCNCQHVRDGHSFVKTRAEMQSLLHASTSKLNRIREVRLIREIRELDAAWVEQWPRGWDVAHGSEVIQTPARNRSAVNRLLHRTHRPHFDLGEVLKRPISGPAKRKPPDGKARVPSPLGATIFAVAVLLFGVLLLAIGAFALAGGSVPESMSAGAPLYFVLMGLFTLIVFVPPSFALIGKANDYKRLRSSYVRDRRKVVAQLSAVRRRDLSQNQ